MTKTDSRNHLAELAVHVMQEVYLPRITTCLETLSPEQIWWRPNAASNSAGNLALHLAVNVRQWITAGLGGAADVRQRDLEFSEQGPVARRVLVARLRKAVNEASRVLKNLAPEDWEAVHTIQKYRATGCEAAFHVAEHFSHHAGQIILLTKMLTSRDLKFTHLPGEKRRPVRRLPAL